MSRAVADNPPHAISLGRYVVDLSGGRLLSEGREVPLRAQTFSVLKYLSERAGQRVPTEEIVEAVWPGLIGSDDHLVQSIGELRRVFGDLDGKLFRYSLEEGAELDPDAAAPERRNAHGVQPLRFRWMYGLIAPLLLAIAFAVIWFVTARTPRVPAAGAPAIAILPFQNQSDDPALAPRADQFTQELIAVLARQPSVLVKSWDEVEVYKGVLAQPGEIARVLAVRYQVEGSVRYAADQLRVSAQLVDVQGKVLWSARYVEAAAEEISLRERMVAEIMDALAHAL
ncbi:MAG TPA: winged helix-turn-helix domain-containing protein [Steroidobacteraceae bacterium]